MNQRILKNGNSLAVTIPAKFVKIIGIKPGAEVVAKVDMLSGQITYTFAPAGQMTLLNK